MAKKKSLYTVREAVEIAFKKMDSKFHSIHLCQMVRELTSRPFLMDGTILRRLREAREDNPEIFGYVVKDHERSIYRKKDLISAKKQETTA